MIPRFLPQVEKFKSGGSLTYSMELPHIEYYKIDEEDNTIDFTGEAFLVCEEVIAGRDTSALGDETDLVVEVMDEVARGLVDAPLSDEDPAGDLQGRIEVILHEWLLEEKQKDRV